MKLWQDSAELTQVRWFRAGEGAKVYTGVNFYGSGIWHKDSLPEQRLFVPGLIGEQFPAPGPYLVGRNIPLMRGESFCGADDVFARGGIHGVDKELTCHADGTHDCCKDTPQPRGGILYPGDTVVVKGVTVDDALYFGARTVPIDAGTTDGVELPDRAPVYLLEPAGTAVLGSMLGDDVRQAVWLHNKGPFTITLKHNWSASVAGSQFLLPGGSDVDLAPNAGAGFWNDLDSAGWRCIDLTVQGQVQNGITLGVDGEQRIAFRTGEFIRWERPTLDPARYYNPDNPGVLTVPVDGWYAIVAQVAWQNNGTGIREVQIGGSTAMPPLATTLTVPLPEGYAVSNLMAIEYKRAGEVFTVIAYAEGTSDDDTIGINNFSDNNPAFSYVSWTRVTITLIGGAKGGDGGGGGGPLPDHVAFTNIANVFSVGPQELASQDDAHDALKLTGSHPWVRHVDLSGNFANGLAFQPVGPGQSGGFAVVPSAGGSDAAIILSETATPDTPGTHLLGFGGGFTAAPAGAWTFGSYVRSQPMADSRDLAFTASNAVAGRYEVARVHATGGLTLSWKDAGTDDTAAVLVVQRQTVGVPAAGLGAAIMLRCDSTGGSNAPVAVIVGEWVDPSGSGPRGRLTLNAYDTDRREGIAIEASGSEVRLGFFGSPTASQPTISGSRGGNAALAALLTALGALGLIVDATTA